ncbi:MAG: TonB family protein [Acidobacteria bacterium]|nr:TonB family protein [Acidobacteriota bacterium]
MTCPNCGQQVADYMKFCSGCGTPVRAQQQQYAPPPVSTAQPSWSPGPQFGAAPPQRKSKVGKILLIIGIVLIVVAAGVGTAIFFGVRSYGRAMKNSAAYALAESTLKESQVAKDRLGEIKEVGFPFGTYKEEGDGSGFAAFTMSVEGEKLSAQYVAALVRKRSVWHVQRALLKIPGGEEIEIHRESDFGPTYTPEPPPVVDVPSDIQEPEPPGSSKARTISGGVLNGKATSLPQPAYPPAAKAAKASGTVSVQVTVDESGKVVSAKAVSGHPLLQASAVAAARQAVFTPTKLSGKPVRVTGLINYNFQLE